MRKVVIAALALLTFAPTAAIAASPHLVSGSSAVVSSANASLTVNAKIAGLGSQASYTWTISTAGVVVELGCRNSSGKFPGGTQKFAGTAFFDATGSVQTDKAGNAVIYNFFPQKTTNSACPSGQSIGAASASGWVHVSVDTWSVDIPVTLGK